jgi:threonine dehydratase
MPENEDRTWPTSQLRLPTIADIRAAREFLSSVIVRTPLLRLQADGGHAEIYLKLEDLQPTGSFKVRGAGNALLSGDRSRLKDGVWTASAGNMGQALAWHARRIKVPCTVIVPDDAPDVKVEAIGRMGARIIKVPFPEYQSIQREGGFSGAQGSLIHPFANAAVMAGNGTIGLEILEDLPDADIVLVPYGGGGLICGIAASIKASRPKVRVEAVEAATATPITSSLSAGKPVQVPYKASFISGIGAPFVFPQMWPLAEHLLDGAQAVELEEVVRAIRLLAERHHVIAEGAGAVALAAALKQPPGRKVVCVVSGGNIDTGQLVTILNGGLP